MVKEEIKYNVGKIINPRGGEDNIIYIDPSSSDYSIIEDHKFELDRKFQLKYIRGNKLYGWYMPDDQQKRQLKYERLIYPCLQYLSKLEDNGNPMETPDAKLDKIKGLMAQIDEVINSRIELTQDFTKLDAEQVKQKLNEFKTELLNCTRDEEFRKKFEPVLKQARDGGHIYSLLNTLLIHLQDPTAGIVYPMSKWRRKGYYVFDKSHPICLWYPKQDTVMKNKLTKQFLARVGKSHIGDLTDDEDDELYRILSMNLGYESMILVPAFYDEKYVKKIPYAHTQKIGDSRKKRLVNTKNGNENGDLKWFDKNTPVDNESIAIYNAIIASIKELGIGISFVDKLNGTSRGQSRGGYIDILKSAPKNIGTCNTLIHELSHEILHQTALKSIDKDRWGRLYVGMSQGRHVVEQQAELSAWIVMRFLGYNMKTNINYLGNWGINEGNALEVFDQVASTADIITHLIAKKMNTNTLNESVGCPQNITGEYVASLLGKESLFLYRKSKKIHQDELDEEKKKMNESFKRICGIEIF